MDHDPSPSVPFPFYPLNVQHFCVLTNGHALSIENNFSLQKNLFDTDFSRRYSEPALLLTARVLIHLET